MENSFALLIIVTLWIFGLMYYIMKKLYRLNNHYRKFHEIDINIQYACPKCGKFMENGFVVAGRGICYRSNEEKGLTQMLNVGGLLKNTLNMGFLSKENLAWLGDASLVIIFFILVDHSYLIG